MTKTKGQCEAELSTAIIKFEKEYMGRGPDETRTLIVDDLVIVRLHGVITKAEHHLASSGEKGCSLIKETRMQLIEQARPLLEATVHAILGVQVKSLHTDISTRTGERLIIFTLEQAPEFR